MLAHPLLQRTSALKPHLECWLRQAEVVCEACHLVLIRSRAENKGGSQPLKLFEACAGGGVEALRRLWTHLEAAASAAPCGVE